MSNPQFDPTKPVKTRDGRKARIICTDRMGLHPIQAIISNYIGEGPYESIAAFQLNGLLLDIPSGSDLINIPTKKWRWTVRYDYSALLVTRHLTQDEVTKYYNYRLQYNILGRIQESEIEE